MTHTHVLNIKNSRTISALYIIRNNCPQVQVERENMALKLKIEVQFLKILHISFENIPLLYSIGFNLSIFIAQSTGTHATKCVLCI